MRVMIIEGDRALGAFLIRGFSVEGHQATCFEHAHLGLERCEQERPDLIILGASMHDESDFKLLERFKAAASDAALLVLADGGDVPCKVRCLDLGADDCLSKPFNFLELIARCRVLFRRASRGPEVVRHLSGLDIDLMQRRVRCKGKELSLTSTEFALLESLLRRNGGCCTREQLLREVWGNPEYISANVVDVYINYLRKKLGAVSSNCGKSQWIETVRGSGYRLRLVLETCMASTASLDQASISA